MRKVVVNSTPLISLATIGRLDLLQILYGKVYIPHAVFEEVYTKGKSKAGSDIIQHMDFIEIKNIINKEAKNYFRTALHDGEVEVMVLANELKADLCVIDDLMARKYAKYLGLNVTGTLGVLIRAKEDGIIKEVKPLIEGLLENGIYIDDNLFRRILEIARE